MAGVRVISVAIALENLSEQVDWSRQVEGDVGHRRTVEAIGELVGRERRIGMLFVDYNRMPTCYGRKVIEPVRCHLLPALKSKGRLVEGGFKAFIPLLPDDSVLEGEGVGADDNPLVLATRRVCPEMTLNRLRNDLPFERITY